MIVDHTHNIQISSNATASANNMQTGFVAWQDVPTSATEGLPAFPVYGAADFTMNNTTVVTIVPVAPAGYLREVTHLSIFNADNATDQIILQRTWANNSANNSVFYKASMATLANWVYEKGRGWANVSATGTAL
jgi:hypothetical protein